MASSSSASYYGETSTSAGQQLPTVTSTSGLVNSMLTYSYNPESYLAVASPFGNARHEPNPPLPEEFGRRQSSTYDTYGRPTAASTVSDVHESIISPPVSPTSASRPASASQSDCEEASQDYLGPSGMELGDDEIQMRASGSESHRQRSRTRRFRLTHTQTRFLQSEFARQAHPDAAHRERLAREIPGLNARQVQVWFQNRRAKMKRLSTEDRESMLSSRALPEDFDMTPALHSTYEQDGGNAPVRRPSQSSAGPSNWEQRRASLRRSLAHRAQSASPNPMALPGMPSYRPLPEASPMVQANYSFASPRVSRDAGSSHETARTDSVINMSPSLTSAYGQQTMLQDGSIVSGYSPGQVGSVGTSMYASAGVARMHHAATDASRRRSYDPLVQSEVGSMQAHAYGYEDALQRRERNQRRSYDLGSPMNLQTGTTALYTYAGQSDAASSMTNLGFNPGLGLYTTERENSRMRRATAPSIHPAASHPMNTDWAGTTSATQGLPGMLAQYTMGGPGGLDSSTSSSMPGVARGGDGLGLPCSSSPTSPLTTAAVPIGRPSEVLSQSQPQLQSQSQSQSQSDSQSRSLGEQQGGGIEPTTIVDEATAAAVAMNYYGAQWQE